jgi:DNA-binding response OmpR family regulator
VLDNGADGIERVLNEAFDVVTLDRMLPDADGTTIVRSLRDAGCQIPFVYWHSATALPMQTNATLL